jgi:hypothetical protein
MNVESAIANTTGLRRLLVTAIAGAFVFAAVFTSFGAFGPFNSDGEFTSQNFAEWLIGVAAAIVAGAVVWMTGKSGAVAGNVTGAANRALAFGIVALVSFPVFWLGIYALFAAGSFVLGGASIREATGGTRAKAAIGMALAAVATVFCAFLNLFG